RDAGADQAPSGVTLPSGVVSSYQIAVADPSNPAAVRFAYVALAGTDLDPTDPTQTVTAWNAQHGYVHYTRDATADIFQYSQSSYGGYGAAPKGPFCTINADGTYSVVNDPDTGNPAIKQRRPGDGAWVTTD